MNKDFELAKKIVEEELSLDIMKVTRKRSVVESRMIFSKILRNYRHSFTDIGKYLNKDHTTIIHYISKLDGLLETEDAMMTTYMSCMETFISEKEPVNLLDDKLTSEVNVVLMSKIQSLMIEKKALESKLYRGNARLKTIIAILDRNTPLGKEDEMEQKIRRMLNGG